MSATIKKTQGLLSADWALELVKKQSKEERLSLLYWNGKEAVVGDAFSVTAGGNSPSVTYQPIVVHPDVVRMLTLPTKVVPYGTLGSLIEELSSLFKTYTVLTEPQILLLTAAVLASWIPEATGTLACVELIGPNSPERRQLLRLLGSLVRRPLPLAEVQPSSLFELAAELSPTLFVLHCDNLSALRKLVNVTSSVEAHIVVNGRPVNVACAKVLCVAEPLAEIWGDWSALEIELPPSEAQLAPLDDLTLQCITDEYQGKLLQFRLANYLACQSSACDAPELGRLRELGLCLTAPLTGHPELQQQVIRLLSDQPARMEQGVDETVPAAVIEALLDFCHQAKKQTCFMGELAKAANQRLEKRGESFILTARDVGTLLSKLGFVQRPRRAQGYGIDLLNSVRQQIHRLAMKYKVANMHTCSLCCRQCHEICDRPAPVQEFNLDDLTDAV